MRVTKIFTAQFLKKSDVLWLFSQNFGSTLKNPPGVSFEFWTNPTLRMLWGRSILSSSYKKPTQKSVLHQNAKLIWKVEIFGNFEKLRVPVLIDPCKSFGHYVKYAFFDSWKQSHVRKWLIVFRWMSNPFTRCDELSATYKLKKYSKKVEKQKSYG